MSEQRIGHNMAQEVRIFREVSEGIHPRLSLKVAPYLPIRMFRYKDNEKNPVVILAGELVALDQWNQFVPANKGVTTTNGLAYTQDDVEWGVKAFDASQPYGASVADATDGQTADLVANKVVGYAYTDYLANNGKYLNYKAQLTEKTVSTDWLVQYPIITTPQQSCAPGDLVVPDEANPGAWRSVVVADYVDAATTFLTNQNIVGKIMKIEKVSNHMNKQDIIPTGAGLAIHGGIDAPGGPGVPNFLSDAVSHTRPDNEAGGNGTGTYTATILIRL